MNIAFSEKYKYLTQPDMLPEVLRAPALPFVERAKKLASEPEDGDTPLKWQKLFDERNDAILKHRETLLGQGRKQPAKSVEVIEETLAEKAARARAEAEAKRIELNNERITSNQKATEAARKATPKE